MVYNIKNNILDNVASLNALLKAIDFKIYKKIPADTLKGIIRAIDPIAKKELIEWLNQVKEIKNSSLSKSEKERKIKILRPSQAVVQFLKLFLDAIIDKMPGGNKGLIKMGASGIGIAASFMNFKRVGIALILLKQVLPRFILTVQFDDFSNFLLFELQSEKP